MDNQFMQAQDGQFLVNNNSLRLRGFGIGSWMNFEHFMLRIPGSDFEIRRVFTEIYGQKKADEFFDTLLMSFINEDDFKFLASLGINSVRLAINYRRFETDQAPGQFTKNGFKYIDHVLKLCKRHNIYLILDMHATPGGQNPDAHSGSTTGSAQFWNDAYQRERTIDLWRYIADRYKNETMIAGYDLINEPAFVPDKIIFNEFYEKLVHNIRSVDNNHILFFEGDYWARDFSIFETLGGHQQALSFHYYPGQHVSIYDDSQNRQQSISNQLKDFAKLREKTGMPLWVGETGGLFPANKKSNGLELIKQTLETFEQLNISWCYWAYKDAQSMSLVYPKSESSWMKFANSLRPRWQSKKTRAENVTAEVFRLLYDKFSYDLDNRTQEKLSFRISSLIYNLHAEYLLKPELQSTPWSEIRALPESFLWAKCDHWQELATLVKTITARRQPPLN